MRLWAPGWESKTALIPSRARCTRPRSNAFWPGLPYGDSVDPELASRRDLARAKSDTTHPEFRPEPLTMMHQRSLYESGRGRMNQTFGLVEKKLETLPRATAKLVRDLVASKKEVDRRLRRIMD